MRDVVQDPFGKKDDCGSGAWAEDGVVLACTQNREGTVSVALLGCGRLFV